MAPGLGKKSAGQTVRRYPQDALVVGACFGADIPTASCRPRTLYVALLHPNALACGRPQDALIIGARFDADVSTASCRLAFYGRLTALLDPADKTALARLRVFKLKAKHGAIERLAADGCTAICRGMFKKETDMSLFTGMKVRWFKQCKI